MSKKKKLVSLLLSLALVFGTISVGFTAFAQDDAYQPQYEEGITPEMMDFLVAKVDEIAETEFWQKIVDQTVYTNYTIGMFYHTELYTIDSGFGALDPKPTGAQFKENLRNYTEMGFTFPDALFAIPDELPVENSDEPPVESPHVYTTDENGTPYLATLDYGIKDEATFFAALKQAFENFGGMYFGETAPLGITLKDNAENIRALADVVNTFLKEYLGLQTQFVFPDDPNDVPGAAIDFLHTLVTEVRAGTASVLLRALPLLAQEEHLTTVSYLIGTAYQNLTAILDGLGLDLGDVSLPAIPDSWFTAPNNKEIPSPFQKLIREGVAKDPTLAAPVVKALNQILPNVMFLIGPMLNLGDFGSQLAGLLVSPGMVQGLIALLATGNGDLFQNDSLKPSDLPAYCDKTINLEAVLNTIAQELAIIPVTDANGNPVMENVTNPDGTTTQQQKKEPLGLTFKGMDLNGTLAKMKTPAEPGDVLKELVDYLWDNLIVDDANYKRVLSLATSLIPADAGIDIAGLASTLLGGTSADRAAAKSAVIPVLVAFLGYGSGDEPQPDEPTGDNPTDKPADKPADEPGTGDADGTQPTAPAVTDTPDTGDAVLPAFGALAMAAAAAFVLARRKANG